MQTKNARKVRGQLVRRSSILLTRYTNGKVTATPVGTDDVAKTVQHLPKQQGRCSKYITRLHMVPCKLAIWVRVRLALSAKRDRKSTRLNSSHPSISYAVFCLKK